MFTLHPAVSPDAITMVNMNMTILHNNYWIHVIQMVVVEFTLDREVDIRSWVRYELHDVNAKVEKRDNPTCVWRNRWIEWKRDEERRLEKDSSSETYWERMSERVSECANDRPTDLPTEPTNEQTSKRTNERTKAEKTDQYTALFSYMFRTTTFLLFSR